MTLSSGDIRGVLAFPDPEAGLYGRLLREAPATKRCPILLNAEATSMFGLLEMPPDPVAEIDGTDPRDVLSAWWRGPCPAGCTCLEPFTGDFPATLPRRPVAGRHRGRAAVESATTCAGELAPWSTLAVVSAARPADIPAAVAWGGIVNYYSQDLVGLCAVLRSWEDRFGAVLVHMSQATLLVAVARPPRSQRESERVAAEHFAFCPDQHDPQDGGTVHTPRTYARVIRGAPFWRFWWD